MLIFRGVSTTTCCNIIINMLANVSYQFSVKTCLNIHKTMSTRRVTNPSPDPSARSMKLRLPSLLPEISALCKPPVQKTPKRLEKKHRIKIRMYGLTYIYNIKSIYISNIYIYISIITVFTLFIIRSMYCILRVYCRLIFHYTLCFSKTHPCHTQRQLGLFLIYFALHISEQSNLM